MCYINAYIFRLNNGTNATAPDREEISKIPALSIYYAFEADEFTNYLNSVTLANHSTILANSNYTNNRNERQAPV